MLTYKASYKPIEDGWYFGEVLDFQGAFTQSKNLGGCRRMLADALAQMAICTIEDGKPLPLPNPTIPDGDGEVVEPIYLFIATANMVDKVPHRPVFS